MVVILQITFEQWISNITAKLREAFFKTFKNNQRIEIKDWRRLLSEYQWAINNGHSSNELFPITSKIFDPVEVVCGKCGKNVTASKKRVAKLASESKPYYCGECVKNIKLSMLAKKAREANQQVYQGNKSADWRKPNNRSTPYQSPSRSTRSPYSPPQTNAGGGLLSWVFSLFK